MILAGLAARTLGATFPYLLLGALASTMAGTTWGYFHGKSVVESERKREKAEIVAAAAKAARKELADAMAVGIDIAGILRDGLATLATHKARSSAIVKEVASHVDATPALAAVVLPADVVRLRREQSDESARTAAKFGHDQGD